jgi:carboxymethylenebutenolidase
MTLANVIAQQHLIATADGQLDAWLFLPEGVGKFKTVILHTDIKGVRNAFIAKGKEFASLGYAVLLPNLYYRLRKAPVLPPEASLRDPQFKDAFNELRSVVSVAGVKRDHQAIFSWLEQHPQVDAAAVAVIGYCMSGSIALRTAADFPSRVLAAASFHGGRLASDGDDSPHLRVAEIGAQLYLGYAKDDTSMTAPMIEQLEAALITQGVKFTSEHYNAQHGFAVVDSPAYDATAEQHHRAAITQLLNEALPRTA